MIKMNGRFVPLAIVVLIILGSFSAVGSQVNTPISDNEDDIISAGMFSAGKKALIAGGGMGLNFADDDATDMYNLLTANGWSASNIILLTNDQVKISTITADLGTMAASTTSDSISLFFFSGHGTSDGTNHAICGYDGSLLYDDDFNDILSDFNGRVVSILDSCYSGGMGPPGQCVDTDEFVTKFIEGATSGRGTENRVILMACAANEYSYETSELQNGVFSYYILEGLSGPADTAEEAYGYAHPRTEQYRPDQHPQLFDGDPSAEVPIIGGGGGYIEVTKYGNQYNTGESSGDIKSWSSHGVELSDGGSSATAVYDFSNIVCDGIAEVGIYYLEEGSAGDGPDLYLYDYTSGSYALIKANTGKVTSLQWLWFTTTYPTRYVSSSGQVKVKLFAEEDEGWPIPSRGDDVKLDSVGIRYIPKPPPNNAPNKPNRPSGETNGKIGTSYTYTTSTTDPDGNQVYYWFDWGDGTNSGWIGPKTSGVSVQASHSWSEKKTYSIKVKAKDTKGAESGWSDPLSVTMPKSRFVMGPSFTDFFQKLLVFRGNSFPFFGKLFYNFLSKINE